MGNPDKNPELRCDPSSGQRLHLLRRAERRGRDKPGDCILRHSDGLIETKNTCTGDKERLAREVGLCLGEWPFQNGECYRWRGLRLGKLS